MMDVLPQRQHSTTEKSGKGGLDVKPSFSKTRTTETIFHREALLGGQDRWYLSER
jgi:hypothetical protein